MLLCLQTSAETHLKSFGLETFKILSILGLARLERTGDASPDDMTDGLSTEGSSHAVDVDAGNEALVRKFCHF